MDRLNSQLPKVEVPQPPKTDWFSRHHWWGYAFLALAFLFAVGFIYQMEYAGKDDERAQICIQVVTKARNPYTGETKEFPTPCDVPQGWETIDPSVQYGNDIELSADTEWSTYESKYLGLKMITPKGMTMTNFQHNERAAGFNMWLDNESVGGLFVNSWDERPGTCKGEGLVYRQNSWVILKAPKSFCATNGVYDLTVSFNDQFGALAEKMVESIDLSSPNQLVHPKYYLRCPNPEGPVDCGIYSDGRLVVDDLTGENALLPNISDLSSHHVIAWDSSRIFIESMGGNACGLTRVLFAYRFADKKMEVVAEAASKCNDPNSGNRLADFDRLVAGVTGQMEKYPVISWQK